MKKSLTKTVQPTALSPLVLESVRVIALEMAEVDKATKPASLSNTLSITHDMNSEASSCTIGMDVNIKHGAPELGLYTIHAKIEGRYGFQPGVPEEFRKKLLPLHPAVNLLGFLRGMVFQATAILPCGSISFPLFDLTSMIVPEKSEKKPSAKVEVAPETAAGKPKPCAKRKPKQ